MIKAEQIKVPQKPEEQVSPLASSSDIEIRVKKLEEHAYRHSHLGTDKSQRIGGIWKRLNEKTLSAAAASITLDIPEGYRMYKLYFLGGVSTAAYLALQFNGDTGNTYSHNVSVFQANAGSAGTSVTSNTDRGYFAYISGTSSNGHFAECTIYDPPIGINSYRGWTSIFHTQTSLDGNQTKTGIASGFYFSTSNKLKTITVITSTGNINQDSYIVLEGLTI